MLSQDDIQFMKDTRKEVTQNRRRAITITYRTEGARNPITGVVESGEATKEVQAVVTDRTSRVAAERRLRDGAEIVEGDIWFSIDIDELDGIDPETIVYALHNDDNYSVVAEDPKGIGEYNRHEFVGKKVT